MMDEYEYAQMIVQLDYMNAMCDQLLRGRKGRVDYNEVIRINGRGSQQFRAENKEQSSKISQVDCELQFGKQRVKNLRKQMQILTQNQQLQSSKPPSIKVIRQLSSVQLSLDHSRRLLNSELQNLNSINISKGQMSQGIDRLEERQFRLKSKLAQLVRQEREYVECERLEGEYGRLLEARNSLMQKIQQQITARHSSVHGKLTAIAQSAQTLKQMHSYQNQLTQLILEQNFMIAEISSRQNRHVFPKTQYEFDDSLQVDGNMNRLDDDDSKLFQQQVEVLRRTIANRSFITQRNNNMIKYRNNDDDRLDRFVNRPTPKNTTLHQNRKAQRKSLVDNMTQAHNHTDHADRIEAIDDNNYESIFKISVQPISHCKQLYTSEDGEREMIQQPRVSGVDDFEIQALEKILKVKQQQMQQVIVSRKQSKQQYSKSLLSVDSNYMPRSLTEPIQLNQQNNQTKDLNNSRFIEQLIQTKNHQNHHNNVRIRTKKSYSQYYKNHINQLNKKKLNHNQHNNKANLHHSHHNLDTRKVNFSLHEKSQYQMSSTFERKLPLVDAKLKQSNMPNSQSKNLTQQFKNKNIALAVQLPNQQPNLSYLRKLTASKRKYKDKIFDIHHKDLSIDNVFKRIQEIKKAQQEQKQKDKEKQAISSKTKTEKIRIFKLSTARKHGNQGVFRRKGKALGVEDSGSELQQQAQQHCQTLLPRIAQQQESIRNTLQSIVPP